MATPKRAQPTKAEIREAAEHQWTRRWREDERLIRLWTGQGLHDHLVDLVFMELAVGTSQKLFELGPRDEDAGQRQDAIVDEEIGPVLAGFETAIVSAVSTALDRFAHEYPDLVRAQPEAVPA